MSGASLRSNEPRSSRFRISSTSNDTSLATSTSHETTPSTSNTTGSLNVWSKVANAKSAQDSNNAKKLKPEKNARLLLPTAELGKLKKIILFYYFK